MTEWEYDVCGKSIGACNCEKPKHKIKEAGKHVAKEHDPVNHTAHYTDGNLEVIDFIDDKGMSFCLGNAVKYIARAGKKDPFKES